MRMRCLFFPLCSAIALTSFVQAQSLERHPLYEPALVSVELRVMQVIYLPEPK